MHKQDDKLKLALLALFAALFSLSLGDALVKLFSTSFQLWQIFILRSLIAIPPLVAFIKWRYPAVTLLPKALPWTALRSLMLAMMWVTYYIALPKLDLSVAAAVYYTLPLFITLFAALFIGEKVGALGWFAVCLGFAGVLVILRPQAEDFNPFALLPLISAILYALAMILTRTKCREEHPLVLSLSLNAAFVVVGAAGTVAVVLMAPSSLAAALNPFLLGSWTAMAATEWLSMAVLALATVIGSACGALAYQKGPASTLGIFDFTYLLMITIWGLLIFGEVPGLVTVVGMAFIVGAGILALRR